MENIKLIVTDDSDELAVKFKEVFEKYGVDTVICSKDGGKLVEIIESKENAENDLELKVTQILRQMGIPASIKGYRYLRKAIIETVKDKSLMDSITKILYPKIAESFEVSSSRVERAIRRAIEVAFERGNIEVLEQYFGYTIDAEKGKPTNSEFIAMICEEISLSMKYE